MKVILKLGRETNLSSVKKHRRWKLSKLVHTCHLNCKKIITIVHSQKEKTTLVVLISPNLKENDTYE
jgi:hypothetical protein